MKKFYLFFIFVILSNCSFDTKTGIWINNNENFNVKEDRFKDFKELFTQDKLFNKTIDPSNKLNIILKSPVSNSNWPDEYYKNSNSLDNFSYSSLNQIFFKSKKISNSKTNSTLLYESGNIIAADEKGNIIVYSLENENIIFRYNFYKKKHKKIIKNLNIIIEGDTIYVGDNLGYVYALNYINRKLLWAKNYKIPFRSNIKIVKNNILISDINNVLYFIDKKSGNKVRLIPTEEVTIKNTFKNSIAHQNNFSVFLNTYGSLYFFDENTDIQWFLNLNQSVDISTNNLFYSNQLILDRDKIIASTDPFLYILDSRTGATLIKSAITSQLRPIISGDNIFLITNNNLLVCLNINTGKIEYSIDITQRIADYLDTKKKTIDIKSLILVNNELYIFLNNSYLVKFFSDGQIKDINKLPAKLGSLPIFVNNSMIYLNNRNKIIIVN